ncbi:MAG: sulfur oxidation c-type cytochrome SoxX [Burkholderiales bacterium]|nr:sulfur oxidation c-type cytochrome SoxX [Burkholderiales bacterium]
MGRNPRSLRLVAAVALAAIVAGCAAGVRSASDALDTALTATPGDSARGREVIAGRDGNCLLCHEMPRTGVRFMGNLGPSLAGVGARLTPGQLRLRLVDSKRLNPESIMPSYYRIEGLVQVAAAYRGKTVLSAQQIEDAVAFLVSLR